MEFDEQKFRITPKQQLAASCTGALLTSLFMTPLDVVKTRLQSQYLYEKKPHIAFNGTWDAFIKIRRNEGLLSLWSGLAPTLVRAVPATVVYFVTYEQLRQKLRDIYKKKKSSAANLNSQPFWIPLTAGCTARLWAATIVSPIELMRTKMQSKKLTYVEVSKILKILFKKKGLKSLWKGLVPTLLRDVPFSGIYWVSYESWKSINDNKSTFKISFLGGALSGAFAGILTTPFDVIKTYRQMAVAKHDKKILNSDKTLILLREIYRRNRISGLFIGVVPRVFKVSPACAIMVSTFEHGKNFFQNYNIYLYEREMLLLKNNYDNKNK